MTYEWERRRDFWSCGGTVPMREARRKSWDTRRYRVVQACGFGCDSDKALGCCCCGICPNHPHPSIGVGLTPRTASTTGDSQ